MRVCLVHHADAVGPQVDTQRPLSELGHRQAEWLAAHVQGIGFLPAAIWHSGKLRSRQTAEAFLRTVSPFAEFKMIRGLHPDDPTDWLRHELSAEPRDVLMVGHMPHIVYLAHALAPDSAALPLHGMVGFERSADGRWQEFTRAQPALDSSGWA